MCSPLCRGAHLWCACYVPAKACMSWCSAKSAVILSTHSAWRKPSGPCPNIMTPGAAAAASSAMSVGEKAGDPSISWSVSAAAMLTTQPAWGPAIQPGPHAKGATGSAQPVFAVKAVGRLQARTGTSSGLEITASAPGAPSSMRKETTAQSVRAAMKTTTTRAR